jgi:very-short-patch-repair endonuclease
MTDAERTLWRALRDRQVVRAKFRRQVPVGPYVADFLCYEARLVIEVDGGQHADSAGDRIRDHWFADNGFRIFRFWNNEVLSNLEGVLTRIADLTRSPPHPEPRKRSAPLSLARGDGNAERAE